MVNSQDFESNIGLEKRDKVTIERAQVSILFPTEEARVWILALF